jgi:hypothetical protein
MYLGRCCVHQPGDGVERCHQDGLMEDIYFGRSICSRSNSSRMAVLLTKPNYTWGEVCRLYAL